MRKFLRRLSSCLAAGSLILCLVVLTLHAMHRRGPHWIIAGLPDGWIVGFGSDVGLFESTHPDRITFEWVGSGPHPAFVAHSSSQFEIQPNHVHFSPTGAVTLAGPPRRWAVGGLRFQFDHVLASLRPAPVGTPGPRIYAYSLPVFRISLQGTWWLWAVPCGLFPTVLALMRVRRFVVDRRKSLGLCANCGYDLRATPQRCPECGQIPGESYRNWVVRRRIRVGIGVPTAVVILAYAAVCVASGISKGTPRLVCFPQPWFDPDAGLISTPCVINSPYFSSLYAHENQRNFAIRKQLDQIIPDIRLDHVRLADAIDWIRDRTGMNIFVNWKTMKDSGISRDLPVSVDLHRVHASAALVALVDSALDRSDQTLGYTIDEGIVQISTLDDLRAGSLDTRIYDIRDCLPSRSNPNYTQAVDQITQEIMDHIDPESWKDRGGACGSMRELSAQLIVTTYAENQKRIVYFLENSRAALARRLGLPPEQPRQQQFPTLSQSRPSAATTRGDAP